MNGRLINRRKDEEIILKVLEIMEETYYQLQDKIVPDALLEEYTIYLKENGQIIKRTATRNYTSTDYIDSTTSTPMDIGYALK